MINKTGKGTITQDGTFIGTDIGTVVVVATATDESGITGTYEVTIEDNIKYIKIISNPTKKEYYYGEEIDLTGGLLSVTYTSGKNIQMNFTKDMISGLT